MNKLLLFLMVFSAMFACFVRIAAAEDDGRSELEMLQKRLVEHGREAMLPASQVEAMREALKGLEYRRWFELAEGVNAYMFEGGRGSVAVIVPRPGNEPRFRLPEGPGVTFETLAGEALEPGGVLGERLLVARSDKNVSWLYRRIALTRVFDGEPTVTGAEVDETRIAGTIHVDPARGRDGENTGVKQNEPLATLARAMELAQAELAAGRGVRVSLAPGLYREGDITLDAAKLPEAARDAVLIIECPGDAPAVITGADDWSRGWRAVPGEAGMYQRDWPHDWGLGEQSWQYALILPASASRGEMVVVNGEIMRPVELETYDWYDPDGPPQRYATDAEKGVPGRWKYTGIRDPKLLTPGSFGIVERDGNGNRIYLRLPKGVSMGDASIDVGMRNNLLRIQNKHNLVLRNLRFVHGTGFIMGSRSNVVLQGRDLLIEDCSFDDHSARGAQIGNGSRDVTLRRCTFNRNGWKGLGIGGGSDNILMEDCESSFNNWRGHLGDTHRWDAAAVKFFQVNCQIGIRIVRHRSFGNLCHGFWLDHSFTPVGRVEISDSVFVDNRYGVQLYIEKLTGPITLRNNVVWNESASHTVDGTSWNVHAQGNLFYTGRPNSSVFMHSQRTNSEYANTSHDWHMRGNLIVAAAEGATLHAPKHKPEGDYYQEYVQTYSGYDNLYFAADRNAFVGPDLKRIDLAGWQKATGAEAGSRWLDPRFPASSSAPYQWTPGDPAAAAVVASLPSPPSPEETRRLKAMADHLDTYFASGGGETRIRSGDLGGDE